MKKAMLIIMSIVLIGCSAALAQPAKKRTPPRKAAIWGMETPFGQVVAKPRAPKAKSWRCNADCRGV